uniref:BRCT domain-containing protein n=1 Tax=Plectus sambesii TaxID=2011161 RepID=A0A914VCW7_9BILA
MESKENDKIDSGRRQRSRSDNKKTGEDSDARGILAHRIAAAIENDKRSLIMPRTRSDENAAESTATKQRSRSTSKPPSPLVNRSASKSLSVEQRAPSPKRRLDAVIGWVDNANEQLRQAGMMRAADESSQGLEIVLRSSASTAVIDQPSEENDIDQPSEDVPPRSPPVFLFTAVDDKDKPRMTKIVKELGGVVLDSKDFD